MEYNFLMKRRILFLFFLLWKNLIGSCYAWNNLMPTSSSFRRKTTATRKSSTATNNRLSSLFLMKNNDDGAENHVLLYKKQRQQQTRSNNDEYFSKMSSSTTTATTTLHHRRNFLVSSAAAAVLFSGGAANALVKGVAPPPKKKVGESTGVKCTNVDECQELAYKKEEELKLEREKNVEPTFVTTKGNIRYKDLEIGNKGDGDADAVVVEEGNEVTLYFKILKVGKRSYDGISGEGTTVFSRGYGLEDDEKAPGTKSFVTTIGSPQNIAALNYAALGMAVGGIRRFVVLPQKGWEKPTKLCDGGPGGSGAGGDLKTDYVVVPTATMVSTETCFDTAKIPFPTTYAEQRRMAQRFDQSLLMEVQVVKINKDPKDSLL